MTDFFSTPVSRRRCQTLAWAGLASVLLPGLTACASDGSMRSYFLSQQRLSELLARQFPYKRNLSGLAELTLDSPRLSLLPASNRFGTGFGLTLAERLTGSRVSGGMDLDYGLRFDSEQGAIRMADAKVNRLAIDQMPRAQQQLVSQYAPRIVEHLLADLVVYRFPPEQLSLARNLGLAVNSLRVLPDGLQVDLLPQVLR